MIDSFPGSFRSARALVLALAGSVALARPIAAQQQTGRITGRVIEASSGQGLADVGVQVVGTTLGTSSGVDGRFTLPAVPAGTVTLQFRRIGFTPKTVTGIMLEAETSLEQNVTLTTAAIQLAAQTGTASAEGSTASAQGRRRRTRLGAC